MASIDAAPSPPQRRVLEAVKRCGEATADELAVSLDISASAVRQHLAVLRSAGLVEATAVRGQTGRPADRYRATRRSEPMFVPGDDVSVELLTLVEEEDPAMVTRVFERRRRRLVDDARDEVDARSVVDRIAQVTELMDAQGFLTDYERIDDNHYRINLHNCAIWSVANRFGQACSSELEFIRGVLPDATVERVTHKTSGAHTCAYDVRIDD